MIDRLWPPPTSRSWADSSARVALDSPLGWLLRAEKLVGQWDNESQRASALANLAEVLADADQIEPAEALAQPIKPDAGLLPVRYALVAAYARAGKLQQAEATARLSVEPDGRAEPGAYCEMECRIACALADIGRIDDAERVLARLDNAPADWPIEWESPASLPGIRARIHGALAVAYFKADRRGDYERHAAAAERIAAEIPGDVNQMWGAMLSSSSPPEDQGEGPPVDPMNAIYKSQAVTAAVVARGEVGDFEAARKTLETLPAGRHRDVVTRRLIEAMLRSDAVDEARGLADTIETDDHRGLAYLALVPAYIKADKLSEARALAQRIDFPDNRLLAQMHLALATGGSGESGNLATVMATAAAEAAQRAAESELSQRLPQRLPQLRGVGVPLPTMPLHLRPDTCRAAAKLLAKVYSHDELRAWIESLPAPDARFAALLGVGESLFKARDPK